MRTKEVRLSDGEHERLETLQRAKYGDTGVPYGHVIDVLVKKELEVLRE